MLDPQLQQYFENDIIPQYKQFDGAHQPDHVYQVIKNSLEIAADYDVDLDMVYTIAVFHDLGLRQGREGHERASGLIIENDEQLKMYFSTEQIKTMAEAAEDHRASRLEPPRSIYGKIIAEADRDIDFQRVLDRCIQFQLSYHPDFNQEENYEAVYNHMVDKYGPNSYMNFWLETKNNKEQMEILQTILADEDAFKKYYTASYERLIASDPLG
ncbi:HD domain-containing protein [Fundicoccus sp. Sow4_H7]|uniref:HD domain-containing protein n=1 Tax=Fundicoccus sp. Sow4_H7 TaxID=3438784 RepID=UPI003F92D7EF